MPRHLMALPSVTAALAQAARSSERAAFGPRQLARLDREEPALLLDAP